MIDTDPPVPTRRAFLGAISAAAAGVSLRTSAVVPRPGRAKRILILGGTGFLGPAIVEAALTCGHELTLFNRGRTNPGLFPEVEKLQGQRRRPTREGQPAQDLSALEGRRWDLVIDTSGYFTGEVEDTARLLADAVGQYVFVSSISVYRDLEQNDAVITESSPVATLEDRYTTDFGPNYANYGALKALCEQAAETAMPGRTTAIRPGYIVGPRDNSDRFSYWPARIARGGDILAPGSQDAEQQMIDVRDLGAWIVHVGEQGLTGAFNANGFDARISTAELLYTAKGVLNHDCRFTWVDDAFLEAQKVSAWGEMPCWIPASKYNHTDNSKAIAAGLRFRQIAETIRDTWHWVRDERPKDAPWRAGMTAARESEILAAWRSRK
jgi:2'-hydroxyisoflavone reductase